jgi:hypothetical protein
MQGGCQWAVGGVRYGGCWLDFVRHSYSSFTIPSWIVVEWQMHHGRSKNISISAARAEKDTASW